MNKNNLPLPLICRCDSFSFGPDLGIFGECLGIKSRELSWNQLLEFKIYRKDDEFDRNICSFHLIYKGKRPNLRKIINKIKWIESYE